MDFDKIKQLAAEHPDQVDQGLKKGGDLLDEKTGGRYAGQVDQGEQAIRAQFGGNQTPAAGNAAGQAEQPYAQQSAEARVPAEPGHVDDNGEPAPSP